MLIETTNRPTIDGVSMHLDEEGRVRVSIDHTPRDRTKKRPKKPRKLDGNTDLTVAEARALGI